MDQIGERVKHITADFKEYIETKLELYLLTASDKIAFLLGRAIQNALGYAILCVGLVFSLIALSIYIGDLLDNQALGYLIVSIPLLITGFIIVLSKPRRIAETIQEQVMNEVLEALNEKEDKAKELPSLTKESNKETLSTNG